MDIHAIEYKCFRICSIHLTCQSLGGGYIGQLKTEICLSKKISMRGGVHWQLKAEICLSKKLSIGGVHWPTQNLNLSFKNFSILGGGYIG